MEESKKLTRKEKRLLKQNKNNGIVNQEKLNFQLKQIEPLTKNQKNCFDSYFSGKNLMLSGSAGTGKSFLSVYLSLHQVLTEQNSPYKKVVIVRSVVATRDMGYLPGTNKEKAKVYEAPYYAICSELFNRGDAYDYLKQKNLVEFISTSFIRGTTLNDCIVVVDEMQNLNLHELDSVITRVGRNCKIIFSGDFRQSDFSKESDKKGILQFMRIIERMKVFDIIEFDENDIVRSGLVKSYIIEKDRLGIVA